MSPQDTEPHTARDGPGLDRLAARRPGAGGAPATPQRRQDRVQQSGGGRGRTLGPGTSQVSRASAPLRRLPRVAQGDREGQGEGERGRLG